MKINNLWPPIATSFTKRDAMLLLFFAAQALPIFTLFNQAFEQWLQVLIFHTNDKDLLYTLWTVMFTFLPAVFIAKLYFLKGY